MLSGRPTQSAAAQQMEMQMGHGLAALTADVRDDAITVAQPFRLGELANDQEQMADERAVGVVDMVDRHDFLFRDHQNVSGRLRLNVAKR